MARASQFDTNGDKLFLPRGWHGARTSEIKSEHKTDSDGVSWEQTVIRVILLSLRISVVFAAAQQTRAASCLSRSRSARRSPGVRVLRRQKLVGLVRARQCRNGVRKADRQMTDGAGTERHRALQWHFELRTLPGNRRRSNDPMASSEIVRTPLFDAPIFREGNLQAKEIALALSQWRMVICTTLSRKNISCRKLAWRTAASRSRLVAAMIRVNIESDRLNLPASLPFPANTRRACLLIVGSFLSRQKESALPVIPSFRSSLHRSGNAPFT